MNLRDQLKTSTMKSHSRLDRELRAFDPFHDPQRYQIFLLLMLNLHQRCGDSVAYAESQARLPPRDVSIRNLIISDLQTIGHRRPVSQDDLLSARSVDPKSPETMWGEAYVMEGSAIGGRMMFRQAEKSLPAEYGRAYLRQLSSDAGERWSVFVKILNSVETRGMDADRIVAAAAEVFDHAYATFRNLYQIASSEIASHTTATNSNAVDVPSR